MKFDDVLMELDGFGTFQLRTVLLLVIPRVTLPFHFLLNNFIAVVPSHRCDLSPLHDGGVFRNLTLEQRIKVGIPVQDDGIPSSCQMFAEAQYHLLLNASNVTDLPTMDCLHGWMYDNSTFKSTLATQWDLVCDRKSMTKATATIFFMGVMLGAVTLGWLSDRYGRRRMLLLSYLVALLFGCGSAFSSSFAMFAVMRFFTGLGLSGISIISLVLCVEWTDNKHRTMVAILMGMDWSVSTAILPAVAYLVNDWRHLTVTVTMPLVLAVMTWRWLPESARWLISNGKVNEAHFYLSRCAEVNRRQKSMAELNPQVLSTVIIVENEDRVYSYLDLLRTPRLRRVTLLTATVWYGVASTYYGISLNVSGFGLNIYITQFIYGAIELPAKVFICYSMNIIGRRASQVGSLLLTAICLFCNIFLPKGMWELQTAVSVLGKGSMAAAFATVMLYTTELFPTVLRQNGLGFCTSIARLGVSCAPLIILLEDVWLPLPNAVFCLIALIASLSASLLPETRNVHLPETIEDIEHRRENSEKPILTAE